MNKLKNNIKLIVVFSMTRESIYVYH